MKTFRVGLIATPVLLIGLFMMLVAWGASESAHPTRSRSPFEVANDRIDAYHDQVAFGNTPKAVAIAGEVSRGLKVIREAAFEGGKKNGLSISRHEFLTYCELRDGQCIVMVHVPELRRFKAEAKESLATMAWTMTQASLRHQNAGTPDMKVLVGLRGIALYDRVLTGVYMADAAAQGNGLKETVKDGKDMLEAAFQ